MGGGSPFFLTSPSFKPAYEKSPVGPGRLLNHEVASFVTETHHIKNHLLPKSFRVASSRLLHFLKKEEVDALITKIKLWTAPKGVNVIATRMTQNISGNLPHIFSHNELKNYYEDYDWTIKEYKEQKLADKKVASIISKRT